MTSEDRELRELFDSWQKAERDAQEGLAFDLLLELLATIEQNGLDGGRGLRGGDSFLLHALGEKLQARRLHEDALRIFGAARQLAHEVGDGYGLAYFSTRGAQSCLALLDFESAAGVLGRVLGLAPADELRDTSTVLEALAALDPGASSRFDLHVLRAETGRTLARYFADTGDFRSAESVTDFCLEQLPSEEGLEDQVDALRIRLAEIRLDRGDLRGVEALLARASSETPDADRKRRWRMIEAELRQFRGCFSEAETLLKEVADAPLTSGSELLASMAAWRRIHVLAALNRLDEAEDLVDTLAQRISDGAESFDLEQMRALLAARRSAAASALHLPPASHEILLLNETGELSPESPPEDLQTAYGGLRRTRERVRDEYGRLFNAVLLALHHGHHGTAIALGAELDNWIAEIDSPLLATRQHHLWALVAYYCEDLRMAETSARDALAGYEKLGLTNDAWTMYRVLDWTLRRRVASHEEIDENHRRLCQLQDEIGGRQTPADRALYNLNKWSVVDGEISAVCHDLHERLATLDPGSSWGRRRRRRLVRRTLHKILERRSLDPDARLDDADVSMPGDTKDVYRLMRDRLRRRLDGTGRHASSRRLAPWWLPDDTAVLQYVVLPDRVELFLLTRRHGAELIPLKPVTRPHLWELTRSTLFKLRDEKPWRASCARRKNRDTDEIDDLAVLLGLPAVLERLPQTVRHLAVVPDDILAHVPFAALPVDGRPLVATHSVALLPAFGWLRRSPWEPLAGRSALGVAVTSSDTEPSAERLGGARPELDAVRDVRTGGWRTLVDAEATRDRVLDELESVELAHFACHGDFRPESPDRSGLLLHDGWLTLNDLDTLRLDRLALVVAASCWGASTTVLPGAVQVGLPFALLDRGARTAVASLWPVDDAANVELVGELYRGVEDVGPVAGLARVQRAWTERRAPTAHWAGYVAYAGGVAPRRLVRWWLAWKMARQPVSRRGTFIRPLARVESMEGRGGPKERP